jgi:NAD(P)-dependent dehydrogenase (short-subunit alcohol dehydrogenase family)
MPPSGLCILIGAGPTAGSGIARVLANPSHGNLAVALLSRTGSDELASAIAESSHGGVLKAFKSDTTRKALEGAFEEVKKWAGGLEGDDGKNGELKLKLAIWNIKHSHRTPFLEETTERFSESIETYVTGAMNFSQLCLQWFMGQYPEWKAGETPLHKRGTLIFTGTLGALRTNTGYAAYGGGRAAVRMLAQSLAREFSEKGVHVVHAIANGGITDKYHTLPDGGEGEDAEKVMSGKGMRSESVGRCKFLFFSWCRFAFAKEGETDGMARGWRTWRCSLKPWAEVSLVDLS